MAESNQHNTLVPQSYNPAHAQQAPSTVANCSGGAPPPPTKLNRMLSIGEVLKRIPVVRRTLIRWERQGKFPGRIRAPNGRVYWLEHEVDEWIIHANSRPRRR